MSKKAEKSSNYLLGKGDKENRKRKQHGNRELNKTRNNLKVSSAA